MLSCCSAGLLAGCATEPTSRQIPVTSEFAGTSINWRANYGIRPARQVIVADVINVDGLMEVCGAFAHSGGAGEENARAAMNNTFVTVDGSPVVLSTGYFTRARSIETLVGTMANCKATGLPYPSGDFDIGFGSKGSGSYRAG